MKKMISVVLACLIVISVISGSLIAVLTGGSVAIKNSNVEQKVYCNATLEDDFVDDSVMIVLTNDVSLQLKEYSVSDFNEVDCKSVINLTETTSNIVAAKLNGVENVSQNNVEDNHIMFSNLNDFDLSAYNQILCLTLKNPGKENVLSAINILQSRVDIKYVGPNYSVKICSTSPDDTYYDKQSATSNSIDLPQAWDYGTGNMLIEVGVMDTGIDASHPDLVNRVDVEKSRNFSDPVNITPIEAAEDYNGHGTHVAGIIAAEGNNQQGIAGTCWSVELVSLKIAYGNGEASVAAMIAAVNYAELTNIPILNISYGGTGYSADFYEAIENYSGLVICAAGNGNPKTDELNADVHPFYPAAYNCDNIISVGACMNSGIAASFSYYGETSVDIFAPGYKILSCYPIDLCEKGMHDPETHVADGYHYMYGTSMAAPYVTGVAALIMSQFPDITVSGIKDRILTYSEELVQLNGLCATGGRLNAYLAVHPHNFTYVNTNHNSHHDCVCSICGYTIQEAHTYESSLYMSGLDNAVNMLPLYRCVKCGYVSTSISINSQNEEDAS